MLGAQVLGCGDEQGAGKTLAIVSTPMQYINTVELIEKKHLSDAQIFIVCGPYFKADFECLPQSSLVGSARYIRNVSIRVNRALPRIPVLSRRWKIKRIKREVRTFAPKLVDNLVIGNPNDTYHMEFLLTVQCQRLYLVDDGAATIVSIAPKFGLAQEDPVVFSAYDQLSSNPSLVLNDYRWLRSMICAQFDQRNEVWFVGQYLVESGMLTSTAYYDLVTRALNCYKGQRLVYVLHPREVMAAHHERLRAAGISIVRLKTVLELHIISEHIHPIRLAAFFSSVIQNIWTLFGGSIPVDIFDIKSFIKGGGRQRTEEVYEYLKCSCKAPHRYMEL